MNRCGAGGAYMVLEILKTILLRIYQIQCDGWTLGSQMDILVAEMSMGLYIAGVQTMLPMELWAF